MLPGAALICSLTVAVTATGTCNAHRYPMTPVYRAEIRMSWRGSGGPTVTG
jgi:hypothetical protein